MGLFKQLMIFGKTGLQGLPTRVTLFLWAFSRQGATGVPLFTETFRAGADPGSELSGGSGYAAILAHAEGVLYGTELGSVTFKRIGFFCFPIKHSTHTLPPLQCSSG